jgi:two-component system OmpR family response regulator
MRILLVEDDHELVQVIAAALRDNGYVVDPVTRMKAALAALDTGHYDLVVLDIGLPDGSGFDVVEYLRQRDSAVPVLLLTARDAVDDKVRGLDLGADDYLVKPVALKELAARARALIRRGHCGSAPLLRAGTLDLDPASRQAFHQGTAIALTAREWGALEYLAARTGRIVSKEQLLQALCGWDKDITVNAIEMVVHRLRGKIEAYGVNIRTVRGLGYLLERNEPA